jgi:hypothetical protein
MVVIVVLAIKFGGSIAQWFAQSILLYIDFYQMSTTNIEGVEQKVFREEIGLQNAW